MHFKGHNLFIIHHDANEPTSYSLNVIENQALFPFLSLVNTVNQPPSFAEAPEDMEVVQGDRCEIFCCAKGKPMPDLRWFRDEEEIGSGDSVVLTSVQSEVDYDTEGRLKMKKALSDNRGTYRIEATNSVGSASHQFKMEGIVIFIFSGYFHDVFMEPTKFYAQTM